MKYVSTGTGSTVSATTVLSVLMFSRAFHLVNSVIPTLLGLCTKIVFNSRFIVQGSYEFWLLASLLGCWRRLMLHC